jgi:hypothetical protein
MTPGRSGSTRYICPEDCGWFLDDPPDSELLTDLQADWALASPDPVFEVFKRHIMEIEAAIREHLNEHTASVMLADDD